MSHFLYNLKGWAQKVAEDAQAPPENTSETEAMATSIASIARNEDLNAEQIQRLCEEANYASYTHRYRTDPASVYDAPVVEKAAVYAHLLDTPNLSEKHAISPGAPPTGIPAALPAADAGVPDGTHSKHAHYIAPPPGPRTTAFDPFVAWRRVGAKLAHQVRIASDGDEPPVPQPMRTVDGSDSHLQKHAIIAHQAEEALLGRLHLAMVEKQAADNSVYREVRQRMLQGDSIEDIIEYLRSVSSHFRSTEGGDMSQEVHALIERLKADNIVDEKTEVMREPTATSATGRRPVRIVNTETSLATAAEKAGQAKHAVAVTAAALKKVAATHRIGRAAATTVKPPTVQAQRITPPKPSQAPQPPRTITPSPAPMRPPQTLGSQGR